MFNILKRNLSSIQCKNKYFGQVIQRQFHANEQTPKDQHLKRLSDYKEALEYYQKGKYRISDDFFRRVQQNLESNNQTNTEDYILLLKRLVLNQYMLRRYGEAETYLEMIIKARQQITTNEALIYSDYNNLFLHCIRTNLERAIQLGKALLSEKERPNIPVVLQKQLVFNLGSAYLLKGNYIDAKIRLRECLTLKPNNILKGYALNNLAVASWWHKFPSFQELTENIETLQANQNQNQTSNQNQSSDYTLDKIDRDFDNAMSLFKNAVYNIENVSEKQSGDIKDKLEILLKEGYLTTNEIQSLDPIKLLLIEDKDSGIPIMNISEFLMSTNPTKQAESLFWFKYGLKFFETHDPSNIQRSFITLAQFWGSSMQYDKAETLLKKCLEMLEDSDSYNKVLCLQTYGNLLKKQPNKLKEAEKLIGQAEILAKQLPYWSNKIIHLCLPTVDI